MKAYYLFLLIVFAILGCNKEDSITPPIANFDFTSSNNFLEPSEITFANKSTDAKEYSWDFGDNSTSTGINPKHTYINGGTYKAVLIASNGSLISKVEKE